jgi:hypothetical protein
VAANILNEKSWTHDNGWSCRLVSTEGLTTPCFKKSVWIDLGDREFLSVKLGLSQ